MEHPPFQPFQTPFLLAIWAIHSEKRACKAEETKEKKGVVLLTALLKNGSSKWSFPCTSSLDYPFKKFTDDHLPDLPLSIYFTEKVLLTGKDLPVFERIVQIASSRICE